MRYQYHNIRSKKNCGIDYYYNNNYNIYNVIIAAIKLYAIHNDE